MGRQSGGLAINVADPSPNHPVDKSGERVRAMFASIARRYDLLNHLLSLNIDKRWRKAVVRAVPPRSGDAVLDVCTGTGDLALAYARSGAIDLRIVGIDFCGEMLQIAREKTRRLGSATEFFEQDAQDLRFPDATFDVVCCAFGLRNVSDPAKALREMVRTAKVGGRVAILEFSRPKLPVLRRLYMAYFRVLLPRIGQTVGKNDHQAYEYLPKSVMEFPDGQEMAALLRNAGLIDLVVRPLTFGIATLYVGVKA